MADNNTEENAEATEKDKIEIHTAAIQQFTRAQSILKEERDQCLQDRRFYSIAGAQWEGPLGAQFASKPMFEVNKIHLAVIRIFNEYRNNRFTVNFIPKDGSKGGKLTDTCNGLYRADEQNSAAGEAYDNAFEEGVGGGFGAIRLRNDYVNDEDEDDDRQCIYIEPIFDADSSVYFDPDAKRQDKSDANYCFVLSSMTKDRFADEYPDTQIPDRKKEEVKAPVSMPKNNQSKQFDWYTPDVVYIAEYYKVEKATITQISYTGLSGEVRKFDQSQLDDEDTGAALKEQLKATGFKKTKTKSIKQRKVHKYIISGSEILEDLDYIAGKNIPIVPFYGKRWFIDNVERCMGHVRLAKDTQRLKNMQTSKLAEIAALSTVEKPIFTPQQISGHQALWANDNIVNNPYMLINPMTDASGQLIPTGPVAYTKVPNIPPAMAALLQMTDQDMSDLLGNQEAGEVIQPNTSGVAMDLVQSKLDMQTFIYIDNFSKTIERIGEVWLSMAREIYIEDGRKCKTINEAGEASSVVINQPGVDKETGVVTPQNNLTDADFDVVAKPGPTSASKKAATVRSLINLLQVTQDPETIQVLTAMIMMNMEGEGINDIRDFFRKKLISSGVVQPTPEEAADLKKQAEAAANQPPSPQDQLAAAEIAEKNAKAIHTQASVAEVAANAEKLRAQTAAITSETKQDGHDRVIDRLDKLQDIALKPQTAGIVQPPDKTPPVRGGTPPIVQIPNGNA